MASDSHEEYYDNAENDPAVTHIVREEEMLQKGLLVVRYDADILNRCKTRQTKEDSKLLLVYLLGPQLVFKKPNLVLKY
jgi:hypothetical protein